MKNKKISNSLKKYHKKKKSRKDVKKVLKFNLYIVLFILIIKAFVPIATASNDNNERYYRLPENKDIVMSVPLQIRQISREMGFEWEDYLIRLAECENDNFNPTRTNKAGNYPAHSTDRGIFMINDYWHSEISDECAYDTTCSTLFAIKMINNGRQHEWVCDRIIRKLDI